VINITGKHSTFDAECEGSIAEKVLKQAGVVYHQINHGKTIKIVIYKFYLWGHAPRPATKI